MAEFIVCQVMPQFGTGTGTGRALGGWTECLAMVGIKQRVLASDSGDRRAPAPEVDVRSIGTPISIRNLQAQLREAVADCAVIHFHGAFSPLLTAIVATALFMRRRKPVQERNLKFFLTPHGALSEHVFRSGRIKKFLYWHLVDRWLFAKLDGVICNTPRETRELQKRLPGMHVWIVPLPLDKPARLQNGSVPERVPRETSEVLLCTVGRYDIYTKGLDLLIEAVQQLNRRGCQVRLRCIGYGPGGGVENLRGFVRQVDATDYVDCVGPMYGKEKQAKIAECDIYCIPSRYESFGLSIIEGLYSGIPVLIGEGACISDLMSERAGILIVPPDPNAWTEAILETLQEPSRNMQVALQERETLSRTYSSSNVGALLRNSYLEVSSEASRSEGAM
jgi:glycosyltransferase involved in cell wall biosynthesis